MKGRFIPQSIPQSVPCVLCCETFEPMAEEHLLPNALGWSFSSDDVVCPKCNQSTSETDRVLTDSVAAITTLINPAGRRKRPPSIKPHGTPLPVTIGAGGSIDLPGSYKFEHAEHGPVLMVSEEALADVQAKASRRGQRFEIIETVESVEISQATINTLDLHPDAIVPLAKVALHATARFVPDWDRRGVGTDLLRTLALGLRTGWPVGIAAWDFDQNALSSAPFCHAVAVTACPRSGTLTVRAHVYGLIRIRFLVSTTYRGTRHESIALVRSPIDGSQEEKPTACPHPLDWLWMRRWPQEFPMDAAVAYFNEHRHLIAPSGFIDRGPAGARREPVTPRTRPTPRPR